MCDGENPKFRLVTWPKFTGVQLQYSFYGELVQFQFSRAISPEQLQLRKFEIVH